MRTKFFTGEGDEGESTVGPSTGSGQPRKISKSSSLIELLGGLDELNSWIGFCRVEANRRGSVDGPVRNPRIPHGSGQIREKPNVNEVLRLVQETLFIIQAEVAALGFGYPKSPKITDDKIKYLEDVILKVDSIVPKIEKFIIPGGSELAARLDISRTEARKVERLAKKYSEEKTLSAPLLKFLNRLSSLLFALARYANYESGEKEENPSYLK